MRRLLSDSWFQLFFGFAVVCGALICWGDGTAPTVAPQAAAPVRPDSGRWVVDPDRGAGSDAATLAEAVAGAYAGDAIVLRRGMHAGGVVVDKALSIAGEGSSGDSVLAGTGEFSLSVRRATVSLKHLTLAAPKRPEGRTLEVLGGRARLLDISVGGEGARTAVLVDQRGSLEVVGSTFTAEGTAILARAGARVILAGGMVSAGENAAIGISGRDTVLGAAEVLFETNGVSVDAADGAAAVLDRCRFLSAGKPPRSDARSSVRVTAPVIERY